MYTVEGLSIGEITRRQCMTRGQDGLLLLSCRTLSFLASCRFIPAFPLLPLFLCVSKVLGLRFGCGSVACLMALGQTLQGYCNPARLVRNACQLQTHFHSAQGPGQHQIVEVSQVSDAKYFACKFGKARSQ